MLDSRMLSFWYLHWVLRVVKLQALLGRSGFDILSSGIHKTQAHSRDSISHYYSTKKKMFLLLGLDYCTVLSNIITVKLQKQLGNKTSIPEFPAIVSRPASFCKKFVSLAVLCVLTVSVLFTTVFQVMTSY